MTKKSEKKWKKKKSFYGYASQKNEILEPLLQRGSKLEGKHELVDIFPVQLYLLLVLFTSSVRSTVRKVMISKSWKIELYS